MEIRVLRYFLAVAREGSITKASNVLHLTQPTLSRQIKDLEEELGHKLFKRGNYNMTLTYEGKIFKKRAEEIVLMVDKTTQEFNTLNEISGDVYIGGGETAYWSLIADIAKKISDEYPNVHYQLYSGNSDDVAERLDKGLLDFGIFLQPADLSKYNHLELPAKETWGVIMKKDSPLAQKEDICLEDLLNVPLICSRQAINTSDNDNPYRKWFGKYYNDLNIVSTFNLVYNAAIMVNSGIGYAITIDKLANTSSESPLCFRPLTPKLELGIDIAWKKNQIFTPVADFFLTKLKERFENKGQTDD